MVVVSRNGVENSREEASLVESIVHKSIGWVQEDKDDVLASVSDIVPNEHEEELSSRQY
jgi:hypothetical protein